MQRKPLFITIISVVLFILGVGCALEAIDHSIVSWSPSFFTFIVWPFQFGVSFIPAVFDNARWVVLLFSLVYGSIVVASAIGIFMMKKWGFKLFVLMMVYNVVAFVLFTLLPHNEVGDGAIVLSMIAVLMFFAEIFVAVPIYENIYLRGVENETKIPKFR